MVEGMNGSSRIHMSNRKFEGEPERGRVTYPEAGNPSQKTGPGNPREKEK
jgi:hypothetical protein